MKVLNSILIICGLLLFYIGIQSDSPDTPITPTFSSIKQQLEQNEIDLRPNIEKVIDQLYPM